MKQHKRGIKIGIQRSSFEVKPHGNHQLWCDGTVLELHLETNDAPLKLRKTLNQEVAILHSSGSVDKEQQTLKKLFVYGAIATGTVMLIREPLPLFLIASAAATASVLLFKPTVRLIFDFTNEEAYIVAEVPSETASELLALA